MEPVSGGQGRKAGAAMTGAQTRAPACRQAVRSDQQAVIETLAEAFQQEPAFSFIVPDARARQAALVKAFRIIVAEDLAVGRIMMSAAGEAATLWRVPGHVHETPWESIRTGLPYLLAFTTGIARAIRVAGGIKAHLPGEDCWYLHYAGCHSAHRGKGFGGAAIRAGLAQADAAQAKAYLETADSVNLPIYQALGFEVIHSWHVPEGPQFWGMMRAAR